MRRRSRLLRVAKWGGVVVCVLLLAVWAASGRWQGGFVHREKGYSFWIGGSHLSLSQATAGVTGYSTGWYFQDRSLPGWRLGLPSVQFNPLARVVTIPFWLLCLIVALPTALLWHRDRRFRPFPGHCPCGYDLTGNVSGTCPECGEEASGCG